MIALIADHGWADVIVIALLLASIPLVAQRGPYL